MKRLSRKRASLLWCVMVAGAAALLGCNSGPGEAESSMTSFTGSTSKADTAELFTVPPDQLAHVQVVPVEKSPLPHVLRLSGTVAFNALETTPVFAAIGGPVREIFVTPGQMVHAGQPLLAVTSPDYSSARSSYLKSRDAYALSDKLYARAQDLFAHGAIAEADLQQAESNRTQAHADMESSADALTGLGPEGSGWCVEESGAIDRGDSDSCSGIGRNRGTAGGPRAAAADGRDAMLHDFEYEYGLDPCEHLPERSAVRARWQPRGDQHRRVSRTVPRQDFVHCSGTGSEHANAASAHRRRKPREETEKRYVCDRARECRVHP